MLVLPHFKHAGINYSEALLSWNKCIIYYVDMWTHILADLHTENTLQNVMRGFEAVARLSSESRLHAYTNVL